MLCKTAISKNSVAFFLARALLSQKNLMEFAVIPQPASNTKIPNLGIDETSAYLLQKYRSQKLRYALTKSSYRVDVGFIIDRAPIFLSYTEDDMKWTKFHYDFEKKYKLYFETTKDLMEFTERNPMEQYDKQNTDNLITHIKPDEKGKQQYYAENSKLFKVSDPYIANPKSIQYSACLRVYLLFKNKETNKWVFPSGTVQEKESFQDSKQRVFAQVSKNKWSISYNSIVPVITDKRELTANEQKNPLNKKALGVKTYYFWGSHVQGAVEFDENSYSDYVWAPKTELNKYLDEKTYENFIHMLLLY